ncbi:HAMP domain-containing histidine kinase [Actinoplanes sp. TBRC 11911]|uniref:sensor histidine kinase n=1 Tax=Actinoplanes sp. TBRC 11911 TaxID=2729386 RepID=UPI00145ECD58|nr:HAMP domain-containing sensor histidine kinase [Actinoplanes sp. TBRC 11911]NMO50008.1 HAMP domain-containing histidine kinase [Actinoplanes sp. TBRC 11911]
MRTLIVRLRRRLGVRMRSALAAGVVVAVASLLAGGVLLLTARWVLVNNVNAAATVRADQVSAALAAGDQSALQTALRAPDRTVTQVLDPAGRVIGASAAVAGEAPVSALRPRPGQRLRATEHLPGVDPPFRIIAVGVATPSGTRTALIAESMDSVDDATDAIIAAVLAGLPVLAVVVGVATFLFVGRTLRPVEAMSRQAATITARSLHTRLPVPFADDEIAALATTMNTMLDRIEAASAAQRRFVADASHELRSPLATIHANADLLVAADLPEAEAGPAGRIHTESRRMAKLVDDLLLLARVDDQALRIRHEDVDLDDLVYAQRDRVTLEQPQLLVEGRVEPVRVTGDPDQLHRVLRNLVDNAVRHARKTVTISVTTGDGGGEIVIGNDGPPIPAADRERIFDRFVRLDDSRSRTGGGAGLGLAIARDIVTAHGGTLTVDDLADGAAMRIRIPAKR